MAWPAPPSRLSAPILIGFALGWSAPAGAFIEEIFSQAFGGGGGGGGGFQFQMGDGGAFEMMGGGPRRKKPKFPKGVTKDISKTMSWMKGTEWNWNSWRNVKFEKDGNFDAPTHDCQSGMCKWSASAEGKVYILWGDAGLHELQIVGGLPKEQDQSKMQGLRMKGRRTSDGERCQATFQRVFDFEAADLEKDLYGVLGLPDDAEEADIKKVYRKLSIKYHPDKNPDEESKRKFAEIRDAYEILNDPDRKILYDTGGMEAVKSHEKGQVQKGEDVDAHLDVRLEDLYSGGLQKAGLERRVVCRGCRARPESPKCRACTRCPNELKTVHVQVGPGMFMQQQQEVPSKERCKTEDTTIDVQIERGMKHGEKLAFPRMAEERPGQLPGSVILTLKLGKHPKFERKGDDLHMAMQVSLREALLGWSRTVRHLDGHTVEIGSQGVTRSFQVLKVKGEGMPLRDDPASFGDLLVKVEVLFPKQLSESQQAAVAGAFAQDPPRAEL
mmetsp:Transcript_13596/g.38679  ORF Transcript_13596/g.38679 Transcript_13596/m.38679 type:complete len:498 (-) Transcript_13596:456-1949(-)